VFGGATLLPAQTQPSSEIEPTIIEHSLPPQPTFHNEPVMSQQQTSQSSPQARKFTNNERYVWNVFKSWTMNTYALK
jgi:hypothetical protein